MTVATITSKGQVVIPIEIREGLNLHPGDKLDFEIDPKDHSLHVRPINRGVDDVFGLLKGKTDKRFTTNELDSALKAAFKKEGL